MNSCSGCCCKKQKMLDDLNGLMRNFQENYLMTARDFAQWGAYEDAVLVLKQCTKKYPMLYYYAAYYEEKMGEDEAAKKSWIALLLLTRKVLETCIDLLGFEAPEKM